MCAACPHRCVAAAACNKAVLNCCAPPTIRADKEAGYAQWLPAPRCRSPDGQMYRSLPTLCRRLGITPPDPAPAQRPKSKPKSSQPRPLKRSMLAASTDEAQVAPEGQSAPERPLLPTPLHTWLTGSTEILPVGSRVAVLWETDGQMVPYNGLITEVIHEIDCHDKVTPKHVVEYEDGDKYVTDLREFSYRILEVAAEESAAPGRSNPDMRTSRPRHAPADRYTPPSSPKMPSASVHNKPPGLPTGRSGKRPRPAGNLQTRVGSAAGKSNHRASTSKQHVHGVAWHKGQKDSWRILEEHLLSKHVMVGGEGSGFEPGMARAVFGPKDANRGPEVEVTLFKGGLPKRYPADMVRLMSESEASAHPAYPPIELPNRKGPSAQPRSPGWLPLNKKVRRGRSFQAEIPSLERRNRRSSPWPRDPQLVAEREMEMESARSTASKLTAAAYAGTGRAARASAARIALLMDDTYVW